jgi:hypothetical protein
VSKLAAESELHRDIPSSTTELLYDKERWKIEGYIARLIGVPSS